VIRISLFIFSLGLTTLLQAGDHGFFEHRSGAASHRDLATSKSPRMIIDPEEGKAILSASEKADSEWVPISCSRDGCNFQKQNMGRVIEEVFIPTSLKEKILPKSVGESQHHESEYPQLDTEEAYNTEVEKNRQVGNRYMMVKFGAPNHNCLSCLRFDKFMAETELKNMLKEKKVAVYTTDVGEFTNPHHSKLAEKLGAQVANHSFHIPYVAVIDLQKSPPTVKTLLNGYFGGVSSERERKREIKKIQRFID